MPGSISTSSSINFERNFISITRGGYVERRFRALSLTSHVGEGKWWPIQGSNRGRKKKAKG